MVQRHPPWHWSVQVGPLITACRINQPTENSGRSNYNVFVPGFNCNSMNDYVVVVKADWYV